MKTPNMGDELQQLLCATNWMRTSFPAYAETIAPLHELMELVYTKAGGRTKRAVRKIPLDSSWGRHIDSAFAAVKQQLAAATNSRIRNKTIPCACSPMRPTRTGPLS